MINNYRFQIDVVDPSSWMLFYRLQNVFKHANPFNPEQTFASVQHVFESRNVVDHSQHENSPYRDRPAYLDDPAQAFQHAGSMARPLPSVDSTHTKDWDAKPATVAPKDWSKLAQ